MSASDLKELSLRGLYAALDLIYPAHCLMCARPIPNRDTIHLCHECTIQLTPSDDPICPKCGHPCGPYTSNVKRCPNCATRTMHFNRAIAAGRYRGPLKKLICGLKFGRDPVYAVPLGKLMVETAVRHRALERIDLVVPVPLHRTKYAERGFNQSELLADELCQQMHLPISLENLQRIRPTATQTRFSRRARELNMKGAFAAFHPGEIEDRRLLLIDDVMTTGATTSECAKTLIVAGARSVTVLTAAN